jgi:hypothetical protein
MPQANCGAQPACCPQAAPCCPPQQVVYAEPSCGYVDTSCCEGPMLGTAAYGCDDGCSSCGGGGCESGCCDGGGVSGQVIEGGTTTVPTPENYVQPEPAAD